MTDCPVPLAPTGAPPVPDHVPAELVLDTRFANGQAANDLPDPYTPTDILRDPAFPRIHYYPWPASGNQHGAWVVTRYEDIQRVYEDNDLFSTEGVAQFQRLAGETWPSIPLGIDPPDHSKYRKFLNPWFTPVAMKKMEPRIRAILAEMIGQFADRGEVDIAYDFGRVFPVRVFLDLMGFPFSMFDQFLAWEWDILHEPAIETKAAAVQGILAYLRGFIAEKQATADESLGSYIANGSIDGKLLTPEEVLGMTWFLWLGGLDTVASTISQMYRRLGMDPALQASIRNNPEIIPTAVEEFLRVQPLVNSGRKVKRDFIWHGVQIKAGDWVTVFNSSGNFDEAQFTDPHKFDAERKANRHFTLAGGIHLCLGAHLARRELRCLLDEWFRRIPEFRIKPDTDTTVTPGLLSIRNLPLEWQVDN
ncbi:cytochrome P450 [Sphingorhabdus pulchriflava]|uniref:Cytochrome P450 n=1 Tax=Sphingorhabdus pulchriflava TaxID=2292257 RepID=A0A371BGJ0_9SPHN|nr:cytochrome P450 [Sphingorhabdus pulchriflava]RDV06617.1 cytochrome P450 [Sphingorhabdus pulchriflava]